MDELRQIPQNIEAEQGVLSALMLGDMRALDEVTNFLVAEDFYREAHKVIYSHMLNLHRLNEAIDNITLVNGLCTSGKLEDVGGIAYITTMAAAVPTTANVMFHARIVKDKARLRRMIAAGTEIVRMGYEPDTENTQELLDRAEAQMLNVTQNSATTDFSPMAPIVQSALDSIEEVSSRRGGFLGIPTGFLDFDSITSGLQPGDFIILAARPSMGKTALALNIVANVALRAHKKIGGDPRIVAIFSLEMSKEQLVNRMLCSEARIDSQKFRVGDLSDADWDKIWSYGNALSESQIYIDDTGGLTSLEIRSRARRLKAEHGLDLIVIDYLQLMQGNNRRYKSEENRQSEVSEISRSLKALARELKVPIIALSQLSRAVESRTSKRPMLSDLRESGSLEQDADIVAFLYREDYYNPATDTPNVTEFTIAKHRNGDIGKIPLFFEKQYTRFRDITKMQTGNT